MHLVHDPIGEAAGRGDLGKRLDVHHEHTECVQLLAALRAIAQMCGELLHPETRLPVEEQVEFVRQEVARECHEFPSGAYGGFGQVVSGSARTRLSGAWETMTDGVI